MGWHFLKRWLYLTHRWIGIASCLFFALWFASGLVMLYVPYPSLERTEWLAGQRAIDWAAVRTEPSELAARDAADLRQLVLEMRGDEPVWRWRDWAGEETIRSARDGRLLVGMDSAGARRVASLFAGAPATGLEPIYHDQWTIAGGFDAHRPLWKASIAGDEGRVLYVSSRTGSVVQDTLAQERFWNWLGSVPHWIYPTIVRQDNAVWRQVVMWLSGPCIIAAITGIWIGILRVRPGKRRFKAGRVTPYRGWMMWHHIAGLAGSLFLVLWIFSGWLSVDPFHLFSSEGPGVEQQRAYAGAVEPELDLARLAEVARGEQRVTLGSAAGEPWLRIEQAGAPELTLNARSFAPSAVGEERIRRAVAALFPDRRIVAREWLTEPDAYWYIVRGELTLPVLRLKLDDRAQTWLHIDPATGEVLGSMARRERIYRWLFTAFHRWDLNLLLEHRPARDVLIWIFSLLGLVTSISGVKIGWARLRPGKRAMRDRGAKGASPEQGVVRT